MKIKKLTEYLDGGTYEIFMDNDESYSIDDRIQTKTPNKIYKGYPEKDNSNLVENQQEIKNILLKCLDEYEFKPTETWDFDYAPHIKKTLMKS